MKRKIVSIILTLVMLIGCIPSITVNGAISFNGSGGGDYSKPSHGSVDQNFFMGDYRNRFGYRVSLWFAPQKTENGQYVYKDDEPVWDWNELTQVGRTIDVKKVPMNNTDKKVVKPYVWGTKTARHYAVDGGADKSQYEFGTFDFGQSYWYYAFGNDDLWERDNKDTTYMCAILNKDVLTNSENAGITDDKLYYDYIDVRDEIEYLKKNANDVNVYNICEEQLELLEASRLNVNMLDLPMIHDTDVADSKRESYEDLRLYMINPTIQELLFEAMGANVSAVDFYLGCWDGPNGNPNKETMAKRYTHGIFKLVVETMLIHNFNGTVSAMTVRDVVARQDEIPNKYNNFWTILTTKYNAVMNKMKLSGGKATHEDEFLKIDGTDWYMGKLLDDGNPSQDVTDKESWDCEKYYGVDQKIGNYLGLSTITSNSILARADRQSNNKYQSYTGIYAIGDEELSSGFENLAESSLLKDVILGDDGELYINGVLEALDEMTKQNDEIGKSLNYAYQNGLREEIKQSLVRVCNTCITGGYSKDMDQLPLSATIGAIYDAIRNNGAVHEYFIDNVDRIDKLLEENKDLEGNDYVYDVFRMSYKKNKEDLILDTSTNKYRLTDELDSLAFSASTFVADNIGDEVRKVLEDFSRDTILSLAGQHDFTLKDTAGVVDKETRLSNVTKNAIYSQELDTEENTSIFNMNISGKISSLVDKSSNGNKVIIKMPKLYLLINKLSFKDDSTIRKWSNAVSEKVGKTIETNTPVLFDTSTNKYILGENKEYLELSTQRYLDTVNNEDILSTRVLTSGIDNKSKEQISKRLKTHVGTTLVGNKSAASGSSPEAPYYAGGFIDQATMHKLTQILGIEQIKIESMLRKMDSLYRDKLIKEIKDALTKESSGIGETVKVNVTDANYPVQRMFMKQTGSHNTNSIYQLAGMINTMRRMVTFNVAVTYTPGSTTESIGEQGFKYGIKAEEAVPGGIKTVLTSGAKVHFRENDGADNKVTAYAINSKEEMLAHLSEYMTVDVSSDSMNTQESEDGASIEYDGHAAINHIFIDNGCKVNVSYLLKNESNKLFVSGGQELTQAVSRFNSINVLECIGANGRAITVGGKVYKVSAMSKIPYKMSTDSFLNTLETNMSSINTSADTEYTFGDVRVVTGNDYITNALVYPTAEELKDSAEINVYCVLEEVEAPKLIVVYEDEHENHERTCIDNPVVTDNKVTIPDIADYEILAGYISIQEPVGGNNENTTWTEIVNACNPYDSQWISGKGPHIITITPTESQFIYVRAQKPIIVTKTPDPGDYTISQQTISKQFKTKGVLTNKLKDALVSFDGSHHIWYCSSMMCSGHNCSIGTTSSGNYNLKYAVNNETDKKVVAYNAGTSNTENTTGSRKWDRRWNTMTTVYPNYNFVAWRGYDKPVAASYANDSSKLNDVYSVFGIGSGKERGSSELNTSYNKPIKFNWGVGGGSSTSVRFLCSEGYYHAGSVGIHSSRSIKSADANVAVNVFESSKSAQTATNSSPALTTIGGVAMTSVGTATVAGSGISFYPYVDMKYQKLNGGTQSLNVLSKYKSTINPINTVDYGFKAGANGALAVTSSMWSTHQRAVQAKGAGNSLVGGAMYKLGNGNASMLPQMGITTYQWYVPNDASGAVVSGAGMTQAKAEQAHQDAVNSLKAAVTGKQIVQKLQPNCTGSTFNVTPGMQASWLSGDASVRLTTNTTQETKKYWFNNVPLKTKIMDTSATMRDYYRINSDTNGNVYLVHGSTVDHTFDKNATNDYILSNMSAEWKEIENKTGLVSTYLKSVIRNKGNDTSYGVSGGTWYNEAFPGLCVVKQQTTFSIGMDTAGKPALDNVVDLRLVAGGTQSKADIFKKFNKSFFNVDSFNTAFTFKGSSVPVSGVSLNLRSKDFFIPNATVYDND